MSGRTWSLLVVEDDQQVGELTCDVLRSGELVPPDDELRVELETSFEDALRRLSSSQFDVVVLDVHDQAHDGELPNDAEADDEAEMSGVRVYNDVRDRRFVPIVFFTALPSQVADLGNSPFTAVVDKNGPDDPNETLRQRVREVFESSLPALHQALLQHVENVTRQFMASFVEPNWTNLTEPDRKGDLAHLLVRRLAQTLSTGAEALRGLLAGEPGIKIEPDKVHPMRYYLLPPVPGEDWTTGDLIYGPTQHTHGVDLLHSHGASVSGADDLEVGEADACQTPGGLEDAGGSEPESKGDSGSDAASSSAGDSPTGWYVVLTPACDLVSGRIKADKVMLVGCELLSSTVEYWAWRDADGDGAETAAEKKLAALMRNTADKRQTGRHVYLPAAWGVPDLLVDFQVIVTIEYEDLANFDRRATLDSPYAENLVVRFGQYLGRLGTPDLDVAARLAELKATTS